MSSVVEMNPEDLERLLLDENTATAEQLASMKTTLEHLVKKVDSLAAKEMPQVRTSAEVIAMRVAGLREWPSQMLQGVSTRTAKQLEDLVSSRISEECNLIEQELERLNELEHEVCAYKKVVCETLALVLRAKALQSDTLGAKPEHYEKSRQNPDTRDSGDAPAIVYEQFNISDFDDVQYHLKFDPIAPAQGRLRQHAGEASNFEPGMAKQMFLQPGKTTDLRTKIKGSTQSSSTRCQSPGESHRSGSEMGCILAAMALPEVETYKDSQGRNFEDFVLRFSMKYKSLGLQNRLLNHLLLSKLDGYPKAVAKALPKHIREGNFDDLIKALRSKFELNSSSIQMKAYMDLKRLKKSGDVTRYCLELEKLTREAYPDASEEELSRTRAGELVSQLTDWPEYLQLYTTMEIAPKEAAYEMVKAMAQRCERSKEVATAMREARSEGEQRKLPVKCYNCDKQGHLKRDCPLPKKPHAEKSASASQQEETARVFTASLKKWICGAVEAKDKSELVGEQTTTDVRLLGMSVRALLDTGSQISIIPLQMLQTALESGYDLDADVEEIPREQQKQIFDASGNKMSFKGAIKLTLQISDGRKERIALFVMSGGDGMIVLGTNALQKLGYGLTHQNQTTPTQPYTVVKKVRTINERTRKQQKKSPNSDLPVTIAKRMYLRPGETKSLPIRYDGLAQEGIFWSKEHPLPDVAWKGGNQATALSIRNTFAGAKIFRVGEEVGTFEPTEVVEVEPVKYSEGMLQHTVKVTADREDSDKMPRKMKIAYGRDKGVCTMTPKVGDRVYLKAPGEKESSHNPKLGSPWEGPYRVLDVSENSALVTMIEGDRDAVRVSFDMLVKFPPGVTNKPLRTATTRRKRGRPKKGTEAVTVSEKVMCCRARREQNAARAKKPRNEFKPNFFVIADPGQAHHHLEMSSREPVIRGPDGRAARESSEDRTRRRMSSQQFRGHPHGRTPTSAQQFGMDRTQLPNTWRGNNR